MPIKAPRPLLPGSCIGIAATARKITESELKAFTDYLQREGYRFRYSPTLFEEDNQFGGTDLQRIGGFQTLLDDDDVDAIWIARGGYGTVRILDHINWDKFKLKPKWIIGFSDVTALHSHVQSLGEYVSLHAPVITTFMNSSDKLRREVLEHLSGKYRVHATSPHQLNCAGRTTAKLLGGNLSVLYSLMGSKSFPDLHGKILFLEDLDEYLYHIDRMMQALLRSGQLHNLAGLVVGGMTDMNDNAVPFGQNAEEIISSTLSDMDYPIVFNYPAGHIDNNTPLLIGEKYTLEVTGSGAVLSPCE